MNTHSNIHYRFTSTCFHNVVTNYCVLRQQCCLGANKDGERMRLYPSTILAASKMVAVHQRSWGRLAYLGYIKNY